jgi:hypothetical protein
MPPNHFTPDEANALLPVVRKLVERMVEQRRALLRAASRREQIAASVAGNGGGMRPQEVVELQASLEAASEALSQIVSELHDLGVQVKDLDRGLVDFPALRGDEEVLLCWQLGEDEVRYWHGLEEGFAGRKELPL